MADHSIRTDERSGGHEQGPWDGRFGKRFDDEVSASGFAGTVFGTVLLTVLAIVLMLVMIRVMLGRMADADAAATPPTRAAGAAPVPPLPRLQAHPEIEFMAYQAQMQQHLEGYGWVDEAAGIAHIPIGEAMRLVLDQGVAANAAPNAAPDAAPSDPETVAEATRSHTGEAARP